MTWTWKQASNTPHFVLKNKLNKILKKSLHWWSTFTPTDQKGHKGGPRRAYGWPWIHRTSSWLRLYWTNSLWILPSKPNSWRYRFSSLVFFFSFCCCSCFLLCCCCCFVLFCSVWFFCFYLALLSGILRRYESMKKDLFQYSYKQRFFAWNVSFFSKSSSLIKTSILGFPYTFVILCHFFSRRFLSYSRKWP